MDIGFLKMIFTNKNMNEVKSIQNEVQQNTRIENGESLRVELEYADMNHARHVLDCILNGHVHTPRSRASIPGEYDGIGDRVTGGTDSRYSQEYCKMAWSRILEGSVVPFLEKMVGKKNVDIEMISELLDVKNLQSTIDNNVIILFPLYSNRQDVQDCDKDRLLGRYKIDRNLVEKSEARISIERSGVERPQRIRLRLKDYIDLYQENMATVSLPIPDDFQLSPHDHITIGLRHEILGEIRYADKFYASEILNRPYYKDPFAETFKPFTAGENFQEYLLCHMSNERKQVTGVSWLLAMTCFNIIPLSIVSPDDEKIKMVQPNPSCDILVCAYGKSQVLLAIDCTTSVPDREKINKIRNTTDFLAGKLRNIVPVGWETPIIPVIIASTDASVIKPLATLHNVRLVDINDLATLYEFVMEKGLTKDTVRLLDTILGITRT